MKKRTNTHLGPERRARHVVRAHFGRRHYPCLVFYILVPIYNIRTFVSIKKHKEKKEKLTTGPNGTRHVVWALFFYPHHPLRRRRRRVGWWCLCHSSRLEGGGGGGG